MPQDFFNLRSATDVYLENLRQDHIKDAIWAVNATPNNSGIGLGAHIVAEHARWNVKARKSPNFVKVLTSTDRGEDQVHSFVVIKDTEDYSRGDILTADKKVIVGNVFSRSFDRTHWYGVK